MPREWKFLWEPTKGRIRGWGGVRVEGARRGPDETTEARVLRLENGGVARTYGEIGLQ